MIIKATMFLCIIFTIIYSSPVDTIGIEPGFFGNSFFYNDKPVRSRADLKYILIWSPGAYKVFKTAKPLYVAKITSLTISSSLIGFSLIQGIYAAFSGTPFYWQYGAIGIGGAILTVPLHSWNNRKESRAVDLYNRNARADVSINCAVRTKVPYHF
jgi:hypothetical protein